MQLNFVGDMNQTGVGYVRTHLLRAFTQLNVEVALFTLETSSTTADTAADADLIRACATNALSYNPLAPCLRVDVSGSFGLVAGKGLYAAFPFFELDQLDEICKHLFRIPDLLFTASDWAKNVLIKELPSRNPNSIIVAPLGVDRSIFSPRPIQNAISQLPATKFFTAGKYEPRKAQDRLIEAFNQAFTPADDVLLLLNCDNLFLGKPYNDAWRNAARSTPLGQKIFFVDPRPVAQTDLADWMLSVDCGVFPSRAEGWNLELHEMLSCGKPVITTNYSAHTQFVTPENALLIEIDELEPWVHPAWYPLHAGQGNLAKFGPRQMDQLIQHLRTIHQQKQQGKLSPNQAGIKTAESLSWKSCAQTLLTALQNPP